MRRYLSWGSAWRKVNLIIINIKMFMIKENEL